MGLRGFLSSSMTLLRLARKPSQREFSITLRVTLLGVAILGVIAFIIRFIALAFQGV